MALLKSRSTLIVAGKVVHVGSTFEVPDTMAQSLISRGFASAVKEAEGVEDKKLDAPKTEDPKADDERAEIEKDYSKKNLEELHAIADSFGLDVKSNIKKADLVKVLVDFELEGEE